MMKHRRKSLITEKVRLGSQCSSLVTGHLWCWIVWGRNHGMRKKWSQVAHLIVTGKEGWGSWAEYPIKGMSTVASFLPLGPISKVLTITVSKYATCWGPIFEDTSFWGTFWLQTWHSQAWRVLGSLCRNGADCWESVASVRQDYSTVHSEVNPLPWEAEEVTRWERSQGLLRWYGKEGLQS